MRHSPAGLVGGQEITVIFPNFFFYHLRELFIHRQQQVALLFSIHGQVIHLAGIILQVEQLHIVVAENILQ